LVQASQSFAHFQSVAQPNVLKPGQASYMSMSQTVRPQVAQVGSQQSPQASYSVTQPSSLQTALSHYQSVVQHNEQTDLKPLQVQGGLLYQVGSKLYSCQEYVLQPSRQLSAQPGWTEYQPPSKPASPFLAQHIKPVVQPSSQAPVKPGQDTHSTFRLAQLPEQPSYQSPVLPNQQPLAKHRLPSYSSVTQLSGPQSGPLRQLPGYQPLAKPRKDMYPPLVKPAQSSSETISQSGYLISMAGQSGSQPQMLPSHQSLAQPSYLSPSIPVQSPYKPQVQSSYETISQPGFQTSIPGQSSYQSVSRSSSQALDQCLSVQPGFPYPALNYHPVTNQNAPGLAQSSQHSSQSRFGLFQQVKS
uniref:Uncharacterized protein n=1 Tax=Cyprinus carpio TaxID=7962 RepID=A0A8C2HLP4_CYPCA